MQLRIVELENLIARHSDLYYNGEPTISDSDYDGLVDELRQLAPGSPVLRQVGAKVSTLVWPESPHSIPMGYWEESQISERKMSIPFRLFPSDRCLVNYELVNREEAEFYFRDRVNRSEYLKMIPLIRGILKAKDEEKHWEDNFKSFVAGRFARRDAEFGAVLDGAVQWWKTKTIEKRPLRKEDAKALRMIEAYLKRRLRT